MTSLTNQQKQLLFDYCIGLTSEKQAAEAEALLFSNEEAAEFHSKLKAALSPLEVLQPEPCPVNLAEDTIWRLNNLAHSSQLQLQQLLATEETRDTAANSRLWWNMGKMVAAAAVVLIVLGTWFAPLDFARQKYWQMCCQTQLGRIFGGLDNYLSDHDDQMPAVATTAGSPWWKVGYQGSENLSTTRNMWLDLLTLNSINHNRHGQNVLFCNGSVKFTKKRHTNISNDDIFTLQEMSQGCEVRGCEVPSCETDAFLAP